MAKRKVHRQILIQQNPADMRVRFQQAATAPVLHSLTSDSLWKQGIGHVLVSRELNNGQVAFAVFLVDMYCLGVKNAMWNIRSRSEIEPMIGRLSHGYKVVKLKPECSRKLVEGAVEYARNLGLPPHEDYQCARLIFGDIDSTACTEEFVYGRDGKPMFIAGPNDSPARCRQIIATMNAQLGPQGHHFFVPMTEGDPLLEDLIVVENDSGGSES